MANMRMGDNDLRKRAAAAARKRDERVASISAAKNAERLANASQLAGRNATDIKTTAMREAGQTNRQRMSNQNSLATTRMNNESDMARTKLTEAGSNRRADQQEFGINRRFDEGNRFQDFTNQQNRYDKSLDRGLLREKFNADLRRDDRSYNLDRGKQDYERDKDLFAYYSDPLNAPDKKKNKEGYDKFISDRNALLGRLKTGDYGTGAEKTKQYILGGSDQNPVQDNTGTYVQPQAYQPQQYQPYQSGDVQRDYSGSVEYGGGQQQQTQPRSVAPRQDSAPMRQENGVFVQRPPVQPQAAPTQGTVRPPGQGYYGQHQTTSRVVPRGTVSGDSPEYFSQFPVEQKPLSQRMPQSIMQGGAQPNVQQPQQTVQQTARQLLTADKQKVKPQGQPWYNDPGHWSSQPLTSGNFWQGAGGAAADVASFVPKQLAKGITALAEQNKKNKEAVRKASASVNSKAEQNRIARKQLTRG